MFNFFRITKSAFLTFLFLEKFQLLSLILGGYEKCNLWDMVSEIMSVTHVLFLHLNVYMVWITTDIIRCLCFLAILENFENLVQLAQLNHGGRRVKSTVLKWFEWNFEQLSFLAWLSHIPPPPVQLSWANSTKFSKFSTTAWKSFWAMASMWLEFDPRWLPYSATYICHCTHVHAGPWAESTCTLASFCIKSFPSYVLCAVRIWPKMAAIWCDLHTPLHSCMCRTNFQVSAWSCFWAIASAQLAQLNCRGGGVTQMCQ